MPDSKENGANWTFLEHKGPRFYPPYKRLPEMMFYYDGKKMPLSEKAEEVAGFYAKLLNKKYTTKDAFIKNFFNDWQKVMTKEEQETITEWSKCDFKEMHNYFETEKNRKLTAEEKAALKEEEENMKKVYGFCTIDGQIQKINKFKIERPGIFIGCGENPKKGMVKKRIMPEDVIINCSKDSKIPEPPPGHQWKEVRHDPSVMWLASWREVVQDKIKYVMLSPSAKLMGNRDFQKYEMTSELHKHIDEIRKKYREDWKSQDKQIQQRAVALYFIDKLALRAGNKKGKNEADTFGCCSLRIEHIKLQEQKDDKKYVVDFNFPSKSSVPYCKEVEVEEQVFKNLEHFIDRKSQGDKLFELLKVNKLNNYLNNFVEGLTIKVFRTYIASITMQEKLKELTCIDDSIEEKKKSYNKANEEVAKLCNHLSKDTSKQYYLDPRITVVWCNMYDVPIKNVYSKELLEKFKWAIDMNDSDYIYKLVPPRNSKDETAKTKEQ